MTEVGISFNKKQKVGLPEEEFKAGTIISIGDEDGDVRDLYMVVNIGEGKRLINLKTGNRWASRNMTYNDIRKFILENDGEIHAQVEINVID